MAGIQIFWAGLSSALTSPTERGTTLEVKQRTKRILRIIAVAVIIVALKNSLGLAFEANPKQ